MRVIAAIDAESELARPDQSRALAAALIGRCRANAVAGGAISEVDLPVYTKGLQEAFSCYPVAVGLKAVHGGEGVPSQVQFWPKPSDISAFCEAVMVKRRTARVMAQRHIDEGVRRQIEKATPEIDSEERLKAVQRVMARTKLRHVAPEL